MGLGKLPTKLTAALTIAPLIAVPVHAGDLSLDPPRLLLPLLDEVPHVLDHSVHLNAGVLDAALNPGVSLVRTHHKCRKTNPN